MTSAAGTHRATGRARRARAMAPASGGGTTARPCSGTAAVTATPAGTDPIGPCWSQARRSSRERAGAERTQRRPGDPGGPRGRRALAICYGSQPAREWTDRGAVESPTPNEGSRTSPVIVPAGPLSPVGQPRPTPDPPPVIDEILVEKPDVCSGEEDLIRFARHHERYGRLLALRHRRPDGLVGCAPDVGRRPPPATFGAGVRSHEHPGHRSCPGNSNQGLSAGVDCGAGASTPTVTRGATLRRT